MLLVAAALLLARPALPAPQNYRLSVDTPRSWSGEPDDFRIGGEFVVFRSSSQGSALFGMPADGSAPPLQLNEPSGFGVERYEVTPDGGWVLYTLFSERERIVARRTDGTGGRIVNSRPQDEAQVQRFAPSPDSTRVVYLCDRDQDEVYELFARPLDLSEPEVELSGALIAGGDVTDFLVSPDAQWVVYRADQDENDAFGLYTVPIDGSVAARRLDLPRPLADVQSDFAITSDSQRVVFRADLDVDEQIALYVAPLGGGTPAQVRSGTMIAAGDVLSFRLAAGASRLAFLADRSTDEQLELWSVALTGGVPLRLNPILPLVADVFQYELSPATGRAALLAGTQAHRELFSTPLDGSSAPLKLHADLPAARSVYALWIEPDGTRVAFTADLDGVGRPLHVVPLDGSAPPLRLSAAPTRTTQDVSAVRLAPGQALYLSDEQYVSELQRLHRVPLDGSRPPEPVGGEIASGSTQPGPFELSASGARVVYLAREHIDALQLFSAAPAGGPSLRLNPDLRPGTASSVSDFVLTPDGATAFYTIGNASAGDLLRVELDRPRRVTRMHEPFVPSDSVALVTVSPDSRRVLFVKNGNDLRCARVVGDPHALRLDLGSTGIRRLLVTPDSTRAVFTRVPGGLFSVPLDGSAPATFLDGTHSDYLVLTPDGGEVVYQKTIGSTRQLMRAAVAGGAPVRVDGPSIPGGNIGFGGSTLSHVFELTPDGTRVVYAADHDTDEVYELYSTPLDGSAPALRISAPMTAGGDVRVDGFLGAHFRITPDGLGVVYIADQDSDDVFELYRASVLGGPTVKLSGALVAGGDVGAHDSAPELYDPILALSPDGLHALYLADALVDGKDELFAVRIDGSAAPVWLSAGLAGDVLDFGADPASTRVAFRTLDDVIRLHSAPIDGSASPSLLATNVEWVAAHGEPGSLGFRFDAHGDTVLYAARLLDGNTVELFRSRLDGSRPPERLNGPLAYPRDATARNGTPIHALTRDGSRLVYIADQDTDGQHELFVTFLERAPRRR